MPLTLKRKMTGQELRSIRRQMQFTQKQLAQKLGVDANTVARWERNEVAIREIVSRMVYSVFESQRAAKKWLDL